MLTNSVAGNGYYNYYHEKNRYETPDGKAETVWYDKDLSSEEIGCNNAGVLNKDSYGADLCRKLADAYRGVAEANRAKYSTAQEAKDAIWAKYTSTREYSAYSHEEREAMARNEVEMTLFGIIDTWNNDPHLKGTVSKNTLDSTNEAESRSFNIKTLGAQFLNLWKNNGIDASQMNGSGFLFSVNGMNGQASVYLLDGKKQDASFLDLLTKALNTKDNASNLFSNLLYDANKQGIVPRNSLTKWKLYNNFKQVTGLDIEKFEQTENGFIDNEGRNAVDIYDKAIMEKKDMPSEHKVAAKEYFRTIVNDAMKYSIFEVPDLVLSMEYRNGEVYMNGDKPHVDLRA